jgi:hypothetical protein
MAALAVRSSKIPPLFVAKSEDAMSDATGGNRLARFGFQLSAQFLHDAAVINRDSVA